ncbi:MAG: threonine/serine dehydratase [Pseudomonadota bacterium]|nr:threonine/serine dehydratase [Pseudomonadota bacterium]
MSESILNAANIRSTQQLLCTHVRRTPIIEVAGEDFGLAGITLVFKLEFLQHAGSFKTRGAFAHMLTRSVPVSGVVAASGGNHGAATAYAAMKSGYRATIFVPKVASAAKLEQIRSYGADLRVIGDGYADALVASQEWQRQSGAMPVHAFDQPETLLGQATVALEFEEQAPDLDAVLVAVGGGGLIGGMAAWYAGRTPLVAVEPEAAPTLCMALRAGEPVDAPAGGLAADSLAPKRVGQLMFPIAQEFVSDAVLVTDEAIAAAQLALWRVLRIVAEPGGAAALAALLSGAWHPKPGQRVGVLLCGANSTAVQFPTIPKDVDEPNRH